jgi:hypothetical protein
MHHLWVLFATEIVDRDWRRSDEAVYNCSDCPNEEIGRPVLTDGHKIGTCPYFDVD